jgi:hypothetical protein
VDSGRRAASSTPSSQQRTVALFQEIYEYLSSMLLVLTLECWPFSIVPLYWYFHEYCCADSLQFLSSWLDVRCNYQELDYMLVRTFEQTNKNKKDSKPGSARWAQAQAARWAEPSSTFSASDSSQSLFAMYGGVSRHTGHVWDSWFKHSSELHIRVVWRSWPWTWNLVTLSDPELVWLGRVTYIRLYQG